MVSGGWGEMKGAVGVDLMIQINWYYERLSALFIRYAISVIMKHM